VGSVGPVGLGRIVADAHAVFDNHLLASSVVERQVPLCSDRVRRVVVGVVFGMVVVVAVRIVVVLRRISGCGRLLSSGNPFSGADRVPANNPPVPW
jgi:hypothetical protein